MSIKKPFIVAVVGPTASGKTSLGVLLAKKLNGEVISADSMQIYKGLDIISAKPTVEEMEGIPHHLIDFLDRDKSFSVADYVELANEKIKDILSRGKLPIIVGGTGLYINSLLNNIQFSETVYDEKYRKELYDFADEFGNEALYQKLVEVDPQRASELHYNNVVRVVRALEMFKETNKLFAENKAESIVEESPYNSIIFGLNYTDREILYNRINKRVDIMAQQGIVEEARQIYQESSKIKTAFNAIGYKELIPYFENEASLEQCFDKIKQETRRYAKRQLTWFRKNEKINWLMLDNFNEKTTIFEICQKCIAKQKKL